MNNVLNEEDIEWLEIRMNNVEEYIDEYQHCLTTVINSFENEGITQSFYEVGKFGTEQKERMKAIKEAIDEFHTLINKDGGLVAKTKEFIKSAKALNQTGKE